ncbi:MAG TPA: glycine--tRNA ligase subunit beta [Vicinamibacterales bacterium]|nr:glycine--tRNA ligase subunit beta [Vicinamibacterales bacterium]
MDRELLLEIGTEEIPANWLPALTTQLGQVLEAKLKEARLAADDPIETYSTPRRLTVRSARIAERQTDLEEQVTGPPVSAAFGADGKLTPAGAGFAKKHGIPEDQIERITTPKGEYISVKKHQRGRAAVDVLPEVLTGVLRGMTFPKQMRWDAQLNDGRGELPFGRPIRWILYLYGGRVVPFTIARSALAQNSRVQEINAGASTYGHRFLTTTGRPGRAVKVKHFDDYRKRLNEHFVMLDRAERHDRIARELDSEARRRGGRIAKSLVGQGMLDEVPDLVEYPVVISGTFAQEFLSLPEEVLTTTMIHHQHFFPITNDQGRLLPVFLAVLNMEPEQPEVISRNMERVLTARLRDARFFYESDREKPLAGYIDRLATVLFHKKLGSFKEKAARLETLARSICADVFSKPDLADHAAEAGRLCKADQATDMVRELTELSGTIGGIYAREDGRPEEVWKAIYFHYLPIGVEAHAPPTKEQLGKAALTWAAVSLADKIDTVRGMFEAGERPTGSRDPYGLRRAAQGIARILVDLPELTGLDLRLTLGQIFGPPSHQGGPPSQQAATADPDEFMLDRVRYLLEQRGYDPRNVRAVTHSEIRQLSPLTAKRKLEVLPEFTESTEFRQLAILFKRVKNIAKNLDPAARDLGGKLKEPAEKALAAEIDRLEPVIQSAVASGTGYRQAFAEAAKAGPAVAKFFDDVMVMTDDAKLRDARLRLLRRLEGLILQLADVSELVPEEK